MFNVAIKTAFTEHNFRIDAETLEQARKIAVSKLIDHGIETSGADFSGWNLDGVDFENVRAAGVNLTGASLRGANLENADFNGSNFTDADLSGANLTHADLQSAIMTRSKIDEQTRLAYVCFDHAIDARHLISDEHEFESMFEQVYKRGEVFAGGNYSDTERITREWINAGFFADDAGRWMDVGFWSAGAAKSVKESTVGTPEAAEQVSRELVKQNPDVFQGNTAIYRLCNGDIGLDLFVSGLSK